MESCGVVGQPGWCPGPGLSCSHGHWVKAHLPSFGFRLHDSKCTVTPCDKVRSQTGKGKQACESQGTGGGEASGDTWPILTLGPLLLSWAIVTQRREATPEPGRTLHQGLVQWQCHLSREVGMPGFPGSPLPRPLPCVPEWRPETTLLLYWSLSSECAACAHSSKIPGDPVKSQL